MFFGAISGSSVAAASAVGKIMGPLEKEEGEAGRHPYIRLIGIRITAVSCSVFAATICTPP